MGRKLYVGNLTYGVTDSTLQQMFAAARQRSSRPRSSWIGTPAARRASASWR